MNENTKTYPSGMVRNLHTGGFDIALTKADKEEMAKKNIIAMCADSTGHFCIYKKTKKGRNIEQKERFLTPQEAIKALK